MDSEPRSIERRGPREENEKLSTGNWRRDKPVEEIATEHRGGRSDNNDKGNWRRDTSVNDSSSRSRPPREPRAPLPPTKADVTDNWRSSKPVEDIPVRQPSRDRDFRRPDRPTTAGAREEKMTKRPFSGSSEQTIASTKADEASSWRRPGDSPVSSPTKPMGRRNDERKSFSRDDKTERSWRQPVEHKFAKTAPKDPKSKKEVTDSDGFSMTANYSKKSNNSINQTGEKNVKVENTFGLLSMVIFDDLNP